MPWERGAPEYRVYATGRWICVSNLREGALIAGVDDGVLPSHMTTQSPAVLNLPLGAPSGCFCYRVASGRGMSRSTLLQRAAFQTRKGSS